MRDVFKSTIMKDENRKANDNPQENYPRPADSDKQFQQQEEFVQKQSNRTENETTSRPEEETRGGGKNDTLGNP